MMLYIAQKEIAIMLMNYKLQDNKTVKLEFYPKTIIHLTTFSIIRGNSLSKKRKQV